VLVPPVFAPPVLVPPVGLAPEPELPPPPVLACGSSSTTRVAGFSVQAAARASAPKNAVPRRMSFLRGIERYHHLRWQSQESQVELE
jgi:hypothetical protein